MTLGAWFRAAARGSLPPGPEPRRARPGDGLWVFGAALVLRAFVAAYGAGRFPPADDGGFYHVVAQRIALGLGYTWLWPDGAVTYAAHYPVGYPALLGTRRACQVSCRDR